MNPQPKEKDRIIPVSEFRKMKVKPEKSLQKLKQDLDKVFNAWIRKRDTLPDGSFICISCDKRKLNNGENMHAGHFHSAGHNEAIRWNKFNVNGQCDRCNYFLHGNFEGYQKGMLKKYGTKVLNDLEIQRHNKSKMFKFEVQHLIEFYKKQLTEMK